MGVRDVGETDEIGDHAGRVGDRLDVDGLRAVGDRRSDGVSLRLGEERGLETESGECHLHQRAGAAVELGARDDVVALTGERGEGEELR